MNVSNTTRGFATMLFGVFLTFTLPDFGVGVWRQVLRGVGCLIIVIGWAYIMYVTRRQETRYPSAVRSRIAEGLRRGRESGRN